MYRPWFASMGGRSHEGTQFMINRGATQHFRIVTTESKSSTTIMGNHSQWNGTCSKSANANALLNYADNSLLTRAPHRRPSINHV